MKVATRLIWTNALMFESSQDLVDNLLQGAEDDDDRWRPHGALESLKCSYVTGESAHDSRTWSHTDDRPPLTHTHTHTLQLLLCLALVALKQHASASGGLRSQ